MDLELELVRHIVAGNYPKLKKQYGFSPTFIPDKGEGPRLKALCHFVEENKPSKTVLKHEFSWLEDEYFDEPETEISYLAGKVKERHAKDQHRELVIRLAHAEPKDYQATYVQGMREIQKILADNTTQATTTDFRDVIDEAMRRQKEGKNRGVSLGFREVDQLTGGVRPGHLAILAALPKRMKTWFLIKSFIAQLDAGERPILFSLELSTSEVIGRIACLDSGVAYSRYVSGAVTALETAQIMKAVSKREGQFGVISQPNLGERFVGHLILEADRNDATSILIDQFSFLTPVGNHFRENEAYKEIIYDLKNSAMTYDLPIYMAAQLNREQTNDDFPIAQHLGLTRAVEEASDLIMGIQINDGLREENQARLGVVEGRHCRSGKEARWLVGYEFNKRTSFELEGPDAF